MERSHITQSDAPRQNLTKQAIGVCMALIIFAFGQCLITDSTNPRNSANIGQTPPNSALHNSGSLAQSCSQYSSVNRPSDCLQSTPQAHIYNPALRLLDGELRETSLGKPLSDRVLAYLAKAELSEPDAWMRDDIRVAWLTVLRCAQNVPDPWRYSFWTYYGTVPEKAIPYWQQRTADREWMLGRVAAYEKSKKQNRPAITYMPKKGVA